MALRRKPDSWYMIAMGRCTGPPHLAALRLADLYHLGFSLKILQILSGRAGGSLAQAVSSPSIKISPMCFPANTRMVIACTLPLSGCLFEIGFNFSQVTTTDDKFRIGTLQTDDIQPFIIFHQLVEESIIDQSTAMYPDKAVR